MDEYIKVRSGESDFTSECADDEIETKIKDYGFELLPATQTPRSNKDLPTIDAQKSTSTSILLGDYMNIIVVNSGSGLVQGDPGRMQRAGKAGSLRLSASHWTVPVAVLVKLP